MIGETHREEQSRLEHERDVGDREDRLARADRQADHHDAPVLITREHAIAVARNVGKGYGYAVALHGSGIRDVDLIAVPWIPDTAINGRMLVETIAESLPGVVVGKPESRPHGRTGWTIYPRWAYGFDRWYLDISVMHRHRSRARVA